MTVKQMQALDQIKAWAFPAMLAITIYFLKSIVDKIDEMNDKLNDLNANQQVIKAQLTRQREDTISLQLDVNELKKTLDTEY